MSNLLRYKTDQKYIIFDFETESLRLHTKNRAWQLGYLLIENGRIVKSCNKYLWWDDLRVSEGAAKATRFNYDDYKIKAEDPEPILIEFNNILSNPEYIKIGHNLLNFDVYINNIMLLELGKNRNFNYLNNLIDTNSLSKMIKLGIKSVDKEKWYETFLKFSNYIEKGLKTSLTTIGKENNIEANYEHLHNADEDIKLNYEVFKKLIWQIEI